MPMSLRPTRRQVNAKGLLRLPRVLYRGKFMPARRRQAAEEGSVAGTKILARPPGSVTIRWIILLYWNGF